MIQRVSRRNGRTERIRLSNPKLIGLMIALVIAVSGAAHLAWALNAPPPDSSSKRAETPDDEQTTPRSYEGLIMPQRETPDEEFEPEAFDEALEEDPPSLEEGASFEAPSASSEPSSAPAAQPSSPSPSATVIHHTKYREETAYRIVHHQASTAREVMENGRPTIQWSLCPICFKRHDAAFNERIVDHVTPVFCDACGKKHASDYDETVYG